MAVMAFLALAVTCGFFVYVLLQFWREEKHPRRATGNPHTARVLRFKNEQKAEREIR